MGEILKYILFRIILVIITLHAIIPHPHSDELTEREHIDFHKNSNSIVGIIRLAFHESNDENLDNLVYAQLESVKKSNFEIKFYGFSVSNNLQFKIEKKTTGKRVFVSKNDLNKISFVKLNGLRGPPFLS